MKNVSDYRAEMLTILGDPAGRRYREAELDLALRQALQTLGDCRPYPDPDRDNACPWPDERGFRIGGLDGAAQTTIPDSLMLTVCTGAAGYAMLIRARAVTEVFGKRPEDREALTAQGESLIRDFLSELLAAAREAYLRSDPWPGKGFPI